MNKKKRRSPTYDGPSPVTTKPDIIPGQTIRDLQQQEDEMRSVITLIKRDEAKLVAALNNPPTPNAALRQAFKR